MPSEIVQPTNAFGINNQYMKPVSVALLNDNRPFSPYFFLPLPLTRLEQNLFLIMDFCVLIMF